MAMDSSFEVKIPNDKNIMVSSNEMFLRATINRNLQKLLENDIALAKVIDHYGTDSEFSIQIYKDTRVYAKGDVVVYPEYSKDGTEIANIYLLESTIDGNANKPEYEIVNKFIKDFSGSGWRESNPLFSIYNSSDESINISSFLEYAISDKFQLSHENDTSMHKFGKISIDDLSAKLLLKDFSNIADSRNRLFWAYETGRAEAPNYSGVYKKWGNGVLEYDLTFCLGDSVQVEKTISDSGSIVTTNYIKANSFVPLSSSTFNNDDYFLNADSYRIFNRTGESVKYNGAVPQTNVNAQVNVYTGTLTFPIPFVDDKYMVFTSSTALSPSGKSQSPNAFAFSNRTKKSITVLYSIPNYNGVADLASVILQNNAFQCQIIGRWK